MVADCDETGNIKNIILMNIIDVFLKSTRGGQQGWQLMVRLTPKASQTKIGEIAFDEKEGLYLKVYVTAIPEDNKANKALLEILSKTFKVPKSNLQILSGLTARHKLIWFSKEPNLKSFNL